VVSKSVHQKRLDIVMPILPAVLLIVQAPPRPFHILLAFEQEDK
jgi:hypothetical protein